MQQKPNVLPIIFIVIIITLVVVGGAYFFHRSLQNLTNKQGVQQLPQPVQKVEQPVQQPSEISGYPLFFNNLLESVDTVKMSGVIAHAYSDFDSHALQILVKNECGKWWKFKKEPDRFSTVNIEISNVDSSGNSLASSFYAILTKPQLDFALKEKTTKDLDTAEWEEALHLINYREIFSGYYLVYISPQTEIDVPTECLPTIEVIN